MDNADEAAGAANPEASADQWASMAGFDLSAFLTSMQAAASAPGGQTIAARLAPLHSLEEAKSRYLDKAVSKPDGSSRGTIIDVHSQADGSEAQEAIFLFHAKFEDQTEEFLTYDQLLANLALGSNPAPAPAPVPASTSAQPLAFDPQGSFEALLSSLIQAGGDPMQILQTLPLPSTTGDAAVDALINLYNQGQTETDEQVEGASAPSGGQKKKPAVKRNPKPPGESGPAPAKTRHRPFRYIQLPVATAHGLYGELQFPVSLTCRMYVDDEYIMEVPTASLVRCRHPRTAAGWQYQLYGVQDFRRKYEGNQLKITKLERAADEAPNVCDIYFVNISGPLLLTNHEANKYEGPKGPVPASYRLAPIVPISFVLKSFFGYPEEGAAEGDALSTNVASEMKDTSSLGSDVLDHFPIKIQLAIELNKELLEEVHACEIAHDPKSQVFRLMEDKPVSLALKGYSLLISGWTKKEGNLVVMSCSGTLRAIDNKPPSSKKRSRSLAGGGEQEQDATEALANEAIVMAMTSLLPQGLGGNPFGLGGSNAETEALLAQLFSNPEALANAVASAGALFQPASFDLSSLGDPAALAAVLMANPPPAESDLNAVEGADAVSGLMALIQSATAAGAVVEAVPPSTDAERAAEADAGP